MKRSFKMLVLKTTTSSAAAPAAQDKLPQLSGSALERVCSQCTWIALEEDFQAAVPIESVNI